MKLGVYIHIPFCMRKCDYCSFYSIAVENLSEVEKKDVVNRYINRLLGEIEDKSKEFSGYSVDSIYLGGGTPSTLEPAQVRIIIDKVRECFKMESRGLETTIECNPGDFNVAKIEEYKTAGINRVVLGVQTLNERLRTIIGRSSDLCDDIRLAEYFGISGIIHCVDL